MKHLLSWPLRRRRAHRLAMAALIVQSLAETPDQTGTQLAEATVLPFATLYRLLDELEQAGCITSVWADGPWPRHRLYRCSQGAVNS